MTTAPDRPLDLREFQDIVDEARRLIPRYTPEWTDHNVSDPGITLIELFAWMTEMTLYQLNRVPDTMYERFLDLVGVRRRPPIPAEVDVTFYLAGALPRALTIPAETEVATERTEADEALVFTTIEPLTIGPPDLIALRAWRQGRGFEDYMPYVSGGRLESPIFNEQPQEGDAFYIGYAGDLAGLSLQLRLDCGGGEATHIDPRDPPLVWEYWSNDRGDWAPLRLLDDTGTGRERDAGEVDPTFGLNRPGDIYIHVPVDSLPSAVDNVEASWVRVRYVRREGQGYDRSPTIDAIRSQTVAATVRARHAYAIDDEVLGQGNGEPEQRFELRESPVLERDEPHVIEVQRGDEFLEWTEVRDFSGSGAEDRHFVVDYSNGAVQFGPFIRERDGAGRQHGASPRAGDTLILRSYRAGGGIEGNVGEGAIAQLRSSVPYVAAVVNYRVARGGLDLESLDETKLRALTVLRTTETAVTKGDYEQIARGVPGVGRAYCVLDVAPGVVRVVLVPELGDPTLELEPDALAPGRPLIREVSAELDERKIVGTVIEYEGVTAAILDIDAHLFSEPGVDEDELAALAEADLRRFLHPTEGGQRGEGWDLGSAVTESQIAARLQGLPGVAFVERVRIRVGGEEASRAEAPEDGLLVLSGCFVLVEQVD
jgi:predicted phage baseplate assembly protein